MKLILCSEGFSTNEIVDKCVELVGKSKDSINVAVINEAYAVENNNLRWVLNNLNKVKDNFGGNLELINLLALSIQDIKKRIQKSDVIFVLGGHTDYLMNVFIKTGFDKLLPKLLKSKVYVGSSAGSMVIGKRLSSEAYKTMYQEVVGYGTTKYLELVDFSIMPHIDSKDFPGRKDKLVKAAKKHTGKIYGLRDDSAVVVRDNNIEIIGSKPFEFN